MNMQDFKISYSRINAYSFCPQKYKLIYFDGLYIPVNADITFGHIMHSTLEKYHSCNKKTFDELIETYNENWKKEGFQTPQQTFEYYERGKKMLKNYFDSFKQSDAQILCSEKSFETNIGKYRFIGIIDRVDKYPDNTYEIIDYKTHSQIWKQEKIDKDLQLSFYAYACKNIFGFNPDKISVYFLSANEKIYTKRSKADMENAINFALETAEKIINEQFTPNVSKCPQCDFKCKCKFSKVKTNLENYGS